MDNKAKSGKDSHDSKGVSPLDVRMPYSLNNLRTYSVSEKSVSSSTEIPIELALAFLEHL